MVVEVLERAMDYFARDTSRGFIGINKNDIISYDPIKLSDKAIKEAEIITGHRIKGQEGYYKFIILSQAEAQTVIDELKIQLNKIKKQLASICKETN